MGVTLGLSGRLCQSFRVGAGRIAVSGLVSGDTRLQSRQVSLCRDEFFLCQCLSSLGLLQGQRRLVLGQLIDPFLYQSNLFLRQRRSSERHSRSLLSPQILDQRAFGTLSGDYRRTIQSPSLQRGCLGFQRKVTLGIASLMASKTALLEDRLDLFFEADFPLTYSASPQGRGWSARRRTG